MGTSVAGTIVAPGARVGASVTAAAIGASVAGIIVDPGARVGASVTAATTGASVAGSLWIQEQGWARLLQEPL